MNQAQHPGERARQLVRDNFNGALATLSAVMDGWPFGSVAPYVPDHVGEPVFLFSDLAQHSRNLQCDPRASLLVLARGHPRDMQAAGRVTLLGRVHEVEPDAALRDRYLRYFPEAADYFGAHDFRFYRMAVERVRFIGGFGDIHWIDQADYRLDLEAEELVRAEAGAVAHMNADHVPTMRVYCRHFHGLEAEAPVMLGVDPEGFDLQAGTERLRFAFPAPVTTSQALRQAMVQMARQSGG